MSQHFFKSKNNGSIITVLMGYDRPLDHIFMTVTIDSASCGNDNSSHKAASDTLLYTSMEDADAGLVCADVNYYRRVLERLQLTVPESMYTEIVRDQHENIGNRVVFHSPDGFIRQDHI